MAGFNLEATGGQAVVTFVLRSNYGVVLEKGFKIDSCDHGKHNRWRPFGGILNSVPKVQHEASNPLTYDWVICCTKNIPDVGQPLTDILRPSISPGYTTVVLIQNGVGIEKPFLKAFPDNTCLSGVSFCGVEELGPGNILHSGPDVLSIGPFLNPALDVERQYQVAKDFVSLYSASGKVQATFDPDVQGVRWRKLLINAAYNPICALTGLDTSRLRLATRVGEPSIIEELIRPAMNEVRNAALVVANVILEDEDVTSAINSDPITDFSVPSMLQDLRKERYIEHEVILGEALQIAKQHGIPMPITNTLYQLCRAVQFKTMEKNDLVNIDSLVRAYTPC